MSCSLYKWFLNEGLFKFLIHGVTIAVWIYRKEDIRCSHELESYGQGYECSQCKLLFKFKGSLLYLGSTYVPWSWFYASSKKNSGNSSLNSLPCFWNLGLEGHSYRLQHQWVGVVNRSQQDINKNVDMIAAKRRERVNSQDYGHLVSKMGSEFLGKVLSKVYTILLFSLEGVIFHVIIQIFCNHVAVSSAKSWVLCVSTPLRVKPLCRYTIINFDSCRFKPSTCI